MKCVLVTGALGFIPSSLCERLVGDGYQVVGVDNFLTGRIENIRSFKDQSNFHFVRGDVNNFDTLNRVFYCYQPELVFHYAACVGVQRTLANPMMVLEDIHGIEHVLRLSKDYNVERVFFSSSSEVYGEPVEFPQDEQTTPLNSRLPYAVVKNVGEVFVKAFQQTHGLNYTIFRFFNTYGPRQSPDFVVAKFIRQALNGEDITIYGDGSQTRTFCYIADNVRATTRAMDLACATNDVFNIGSENEVSMLELAELIVRKTKASSRIVHLPALSEGDMDRRRPSIERMKSILLDGEELVSLEDGIEQTIDDMKRRFCNE